MVYVLEVNPRAAHGAVRLEVDRPPAREDRGAVMAGKTLEARRHARDRADASERQGVGLPVHRFPNDTILGPEMKSTGEVMGTTSTSRAPSRRHRWRQHGAAGERRGLRQRPSRDKPSPSRPSRSCCGRGLRSSSARAAPPSTWRSRHPCRTINKVREGCRTSSMRRRAARSASSQHHVESRVDRRLFDPAHGAGDAHAGASRPSRGAAAVAMVERAQGRLTVRSPQEFHGAR